MIWFEIVLIGLGIGFLGGFFGKGGSAVATPLLYLVGVPAMFAVASPLPATIPGTLAAADTYRRAGIIDKRAVIISCAAGLPATVIGALATKWIDGTMLVTVTEVILIGIGLQIVLKQTGQDDNGEPDEGAAASMTRLVFVGFVTGLAGGLLANSGGFILAPLYLLVARLNIKPALAASLAVSAVLAVPGTIVHASLGHIDWAVTGVLGVASIPASRVGAKFAIKTPSHHLERIYGAGLIVLGVVLLIVR